MTTLPLSLAAMLLAGACAPLPPPAPERGSGRTAERPAPRTTETPPADAGRRAARARPERGRGEARRYEGGGWENTLLPQCRRVFEGKAPTEGVFFERRKQMTDNHEAARLCVALGAVLESDRYAARRRAVVAEVETWLRGQRTEHMYGEQLSDYWPYWAVSVAGMLAVAERRGERAIAEEARQWFYRDAALNRVLATPDGRVVAPGCRVTPVVYNPPREMALAWLTGQPLRPEVRRMADRGLTWFEQRAGGRPFDRWGAWFVRQLLDDGLLRPDPSLGAADAPGTRWPIEIRRHAEGHRAWSPRLECLTRPRWAVAVDYRRPEEPELVQSRRKFGAPAAMPDAAAKTTSVGLGRELEAIRIPGKEPGG